MVFSHAFCHTSVGNFQKGPGIVTYKNQLEVAVLKSLIFQARLKLDVKDSFRYKLKLKEIESTGKTFPMI